MLTTRRILVFGAAVGLGLTTGWYAARTGGSLERAPAALLVMTVGLGGAGLGAGVILGLVNDKAGTLIALSLAILSHYIGGWTSPFHSLAGDLLVLTCSSVPACLAATVGFGAGRALNRSRSTD